MSDPAQVVSADGAASRRRTAQSALLAGLVLIAGTVVLLWYAPGSYSIYKALHVVAIVIWVGGDVTLTTLGSSSSGAATARRWPPSASSARGSA